MSKVPTPVTAATEYLAAIKAEKEIKERKAQAAEALRIAYARRGVHTVLTGGHKVTVVPVTKTSVDVDTLFDVVDERTFQRVTKVTIDLRAWHKAVDLGLVDLSVIDKVVTESVSDRIEVDPV